MQESLQQKVKVSKCRTKENGLGKSVQGQNEEDFRRVEKGVWVMYAISWRVRSRQSPKVPHTMKQAR